MTFCTADFSCLRKCTISIGWESRLERGNLEPRNVAAKEVVLFFNLIDIGFSNVNHTCPGRMECGELKDVWRNLQPDTVG